MNRLAACLSLVAATVFADASVPTKAAPSAQTAFVKGCTARLEQGRAEAAKGDPIFQRGTVGTIDYGAQVEVRIHIPLGQGDFMAGARSLSPGESTGLLGWRTLIDTDSLGLYRVRERNARRGWVMAHAAPQETLATYQALFQRAVDDCLAMETK
ncbi:MAG: hypothetical protein EXR72_08460 [Myxococcales bacterium]|nr:hypothetical protein [Myxococcales bacterium]